MTECKCPLQITRLCSDYAKDDFIVSSVLCYLYGGIVISKPEKCFVRLQNLLGHLPNTLLAVFALGEVVFWTIVF